MDMKRPLLALLGLSLLLSLVFSGDYRVNAQSGTQLYTSPDEAFRFSLPAEWVMEDDGIGTILIANSSQALEKASSEFTGSDVRAQILSPALTQNLLNIESDATAEGAMTAFLNVLSSTINRQSPSSLSIASKTVLRVEMSTESMAVMGLMVDFGGGAVSLVLGFTSPGNLATSEASLYALIESMQFVRPSLDQSQVPPLTSQNAALSRLVAIFGGYQSLLRSVNFSPDGSQLVTGDNDSILRIWNLARGETVLKAQMQSAFTSGPIFSPDAQRLLMGGTTGELWLWDIASQSTLLNFEAMSDVVWSVAFSPDGTQVLAGSEDLTARLWDANTGASQLILTGHRDGLTDVAFSPDGSKIATSSWDASLIIWDAASGEQLLTIAGPQGGLVTLAWSPDGSHIAAGARNGMVRVWDALTGDEMLAMQASASTGIIVSIAWSPDASLIAAAVENVGIDLWESSFGTPITTLSWPAAINDLTFSPDATLLVAAANDLSEKGLLLVWAVR